MLSSDVPSSPRPLPPAKARRSASQSRLRHSSSVSRMSSPMSSSVPPPPPYAPFPTHSASPSSVASSTLRTLLGAPIGVTARLVRLSEEDEDGSGHAPWLDETSKAELEGLIQRAGCLIKDREEELGRTTAACRRLSFNAALQSECDAILEAQQIVEASSNYASNDSPPPSPVWTPTLPKRSTASHRRMSSSTRHLRRMSASPAELAALADQNAELQAKLADLEGDAARSEQAGKRRLRGLEKEICGLKDELDRTRDERSRLLQSAQRGGRAGPRSADAAFEFEGMPAGLEDDIVKMWKRLQRAEKVREMRARTRPWEAQSSVSDTTDGPFGSPGQDFAPSAGFPLTSANSSYRVGAGTSSSNTNFATVRKQMSCSSLKSVGGLSLSSKTLRTDEPSPASQAATVSMKNQSSVHEQLLVAQLLEKVRELEEANAQLMSEHAQTSGRLRRAEKESATARRVCEFISDEARQAAVDNAERGAGVGTLQLEMVTGSSRDVPFEGSESDTSAQGDQEDVFGTGMSTNDGKGSIKRGKTIMLRSLKGKASVNLDLSRVKAGEEGQKDVKHKVKSSRKYRKTVRGLFDIPLSPDSNSSEGSASSSPSPCQPEKASKQDSFSPGHRTNDSVATTEFFSASGSFEVEEGTAPMTPSTSGSVPLLSLGAELGEELVRGSSRISASTLRSHRNFAHLRSTSLADLLNSAESELPLVISGSQRDTSKESTRSSSTLNCRPSLLLRSIDQEGSTRLRTLARSKSSFSIRSPIPSSLRSPPSIPSSPSLLPPSPSLAEERTAARNRIAVLLLELWLWLQFAVLLLVVLCMMARRGPKGYMGKPVQRSKALR